MILFVFLLIISLIVYQRYYRETMFYPLISLVIPFLVFIFFLFEYYFFHLEYFVSDELRYIEEFQDGYRNLDRMLWVVLNTYLEIIDIWSSLSLKIINIPIFFLLQYLLWLIFEKDNRIFLITLLLPYFNIIATKNLRDILILLSTVSCFYLYYYGRYNKMWSLVPLLSLVFLRPFVAFIIFFIIVYKSYIQVLLINSISFSTNPLRLKLKSNAVKYAFFIIIALIVTLSIPYVSRRIHSYWIYFDYYAFGKGYDLRIEANNALRTGSKILDYLYGAIRYTLTPVPTSLFKRLIFSGGTSDWGKIDDILRLIHQTFYYYFLIYVVINLKFIYRKLKLINPGAKLLIYTLLLYIPIYTFYGFGFGHQRIKLPFQLAIFLLFIVNTNPKIRKKYKELYK